MKLLIVLVAVVAAASAYPGYHVPVYSAPWSAPAPWPAPAPAAWPAPAPWSAPKVSYIKVAQPVAYAKIHHAPAVHHVINIPQPVAIPPVHPEPLNIKVPHTQAVRLPQGHVKIAHPHLVGVEHYVHEPEIKVVAKSVHGW